MTDSHASVVVEPPPMVDAAPVDTASFQRADGESPRSPVVDDKVQNGRKGRVKKNGGRKVGVVGAPSTTATSMPVKRVKVEEVEVSTREGGPVVMVGSLDEYREGCLKLEKARHAKVFEAEKRRLYFEHSIESAYEHTVQGVLEEAVQNCKLIKVRLLYENLEKTRHVQELLYKIIRDEGGPWQRRHEMSLRGRGGGAEVETKGRSLLEEDGILAELERERDKDKDKGHRRSRKNESRQKVKVYLEVDEAEAADDLAEIRGEKRSREADTGPERRSKKRK